MTLVPLGCGASMALRFPLLSFGFGVMLLAGAVIMQGVGHDG